MAGSGGQDGSSGQCKYVNVYIILRNFAALWRHTIMKTIISPSSNKNRLRVSQWFIFCSGFSLLETKRAVPYPQYNCV